MTKEEYMTRRDKYIEKAKYYQRKADDLDRRFFDEMNKNNKFLRRIGYFGLDQKGVVTG